METIGKQGFLRTWKAKYVETSQSIPSYSCPNEGIISSHYFPCYRDYNSNLSKRKTVESSKF